jgi:hypothetical protein
MTIETGIRYLKKGTKYQFCYYCISDLIYENVTQYFFEYNIANIGETNDFEVFISEMLNEVVEYKQRVLKPYPITSIPLKKVNIKIYFNEKVESKVEFDFKINHLSKSIEYASKAYGNGINHIIDPIINNDNGKFVFETNIEIYDELLFHENLYFLLENVGVKKEDIVINCLNKI